MTNPQRSCRDANAAGYDGFFADAVARLHIERRYPPKKPSTLATGGVNACARLTNSCVCEEEAHDRQGSQILVRGSRPVAARHRRSRKRRARHAWTERAECRNRSVVRREDHQGRRERRQGNRARQQVREYGRPAGSAGRQQDLLSHWRRHHHRGRARARDRQERRQGGGRRHEPHGSEARHRSRGGSPRW